jgi:hypothetical protein
MGGSFRERSREGSAYTERQQDAAAHTTMPRGDRHGRHVDEDRNTGMNEDSKEARSLPIEKRSAGQANADLAAAHAPEDRKPGEDLEARQEQLLDEAVEETFPASDPVSVSQIT